MDALIGFNAGLTAALFGWTADVLEGCNGGRLLSRLKSETVDFLKRFTSCTMKNLLKIVLDGITSQSLENSR